MLKKSDYETHRRSLKAIFKRLHAHANLDISSRYFATDFKDMEMIFFQSTIYTHPGLNGTPLCKRFSLRCYTFTCEHFRDS